MEDLLGVSTVLLWLVVGFNLLLTFALVRRLSSLGTTETSTPARERLKPGDVAPAFTAETLAGQLITLADYTGRGRETAFLFISPTCGPCRDALPAYEALRPQAARAGVDLVLVSLGDAAATRALADEFHLHTPVLVAPKSMGHDYKVPGTPSYVLVDGRGVVQSAGHPNPQIGAWQALVADWTRHASTLGALLPSEGG